MMNFKSIAAAAATICAALGITTFGVVRWTNSETRPVVTTVSTDSAEEPTKYTRLFTPIAPNRADDVPVAVASASALPSQPSANAHDERPPAEVKELLSTLLSAEPRDKKWASEAEHLAREKLLGFAVGTRATIESIECRKTLCEIRATHESFQSQQNFRDALISAETRPWNGPVVAVRTPGAHGELTETVFIAKEGEPMPDLDE